MTILVMLFDYRYVSRCSWTLLFPFVFLFARVMLRPLVTFSSLTIDWYLVINAYVVLVLHFGAFAVVTEDS